MQRDWHDLNPSWRKRAIVVPPETRDEWVRLVTWQLWMGLILFFLVASGITLIASSSERLVPLSAAFSALAGVTMLIGAAWVLWLLWDAAEPAPIADDFLRLLKDSFRRDWRDPRAWPWSRLRWAYGFTAIGVTIGLIVTMALSAAMRSLPSSRPPAAQSEPVKIFRAL